jgi:hypothetical protein
VLLRKLEEIKLYIEGTIDEQAIRTAPPSPTTPTSPFSSTGRPASPSKKRVGGPIPHGLDPTTFTGYSSEVEKAAKHDPGLMGLTSKRKAEFEANRTRRSGTYREELRKLMRNKEPERGAPEWKFREYEREQGRSMRREKELRSEREADRQKQGRFSSSDRLRARFGMPRRGR